MTSVFTYYKINRSGLFLHAEYHPKIKTLLPCSVKRRLKKSLLYHNNSLKQPPFKSVKPINSSADKPQVSILRADFQRLHLFGNKPVLFRCQYLVKSLFKICRLNDLCLFNKLSEKYNSSKSRVSKLICLCSSRNCKYPLHPCVSALRAPDCCQE